MPFDRWRLLLALSYGTGETVKAGLQVGVQWHQGEGTTPAKAVNAAIAAARADEGLD